MKLQNPSYKSIGLSHRVTHTQNVSPLTCTSGIVAQDMPPIVSSTPPIADAHGLRVIVCIHKD